MARPVCKQFPQFDLTICVNVSGLAAMPAAKI
jgi:hypothetical protein